MDNSRKIVVDVLNQVIDKEGYSNIVLNNELNKSNLKDEDKGLVTEVVYGTLKYKYSIDLIIEHFATQGLKKINKNALNIIRSAIYQIKYLDKIPDFAAVNEAVELSKKFVSVPTSKFVNGLLRNYLRKKETLQFDFKDKIDQLCYQYSFERWMIELFIKQYGEKVAEKILEGLNATPKITYRVNTTKCTYDAALNRLNELGYEIDEGFICPEALIIKKGRGVEKNPVFKEGWVTVQDESAMLVAPAMDLKDEMSILDLCSAPGGKATHIGEILNNTGKVLAFDIHKNKLNLIEGNVKRLGLSNIYCDVMDAVQFSQKLVNSADRILIDVPCSGLGIIRKKPEIKWSKNKSQLKDIVKIQRAIMNNASSYLKVGGNLIYSTCTLNKSENEENVRWFLDNHKDFIAEDLFFGKSENLIYNDDGSVTILPNEHMDGFYISKFVKVK